MPDDTIPPQPEGEKPKPTKPPAPDYSQEGAPTVSTLEARSPAEDFSLDMIQKGSMKGDVRDHLLDFMKHSHDALPWNVRGAEKQQEAINRADAFAEALLERIVKLIASEGRPAIVAKVKKVLRQDVIKAELHVQTHDPLRHALADATGLDVLIILADSDTFSGDRGAPKVNPDQKPLFPEDPDDGDKPVFDNTPNGRKG